MAWKWTGRPTASAPARVPGASLKVLLQQHIALRPFYPELERFYVAARIEESLPLDAVENVIEAVREQTPDVFDHSVSAAIDEASAPGPEISILTADAVHEDGILSPPRDPIGELDHNKARDFQVAGVFNRLWKVFTSADKVQSSTEAWIKAYNNLSGPIGSILDWLKHLTH
jgi:hypothetical protein